MKKYVLLFMLLQYFAFQAQTLKGSVTGSNAKGISDAEVVLTKEKIKKFDITDAQGAYSIQLPEKGKYTVEIFRDGTSVLKDSLAISGDFFKNFVLKSEDEASEKIEGVTLTARKKLIERKVDRLVYNVENSVAAQGLDAVEALAKTPMLKTTDDAISIAGKSNVAVMVNDRLLNLSGQDLVNYLKTLRSDDIAKIEVITTPPAKYSAEGKSGLINIVLKKDRSLGWNGTLQTSTNVYFPKTFSSRDGMSLNYQGKKLSVTANASLGEFRNGNSSSTHNNGTGQIWNSDGVSHSQYRYKSAGIKTEYRINDRNTAGISYNYSYSNPKSNGENQTYRNISGEDENFSSMTDYLSKYGSHYATVFYDLKLDSLDSKLSISGNLMTNRNRSFNRFDTYADTVTSALNNPDNRYKIYSGQADMEKNFEKLKTEAGFKYTNISNDSYLKYYDIENGGQTLNIARSNDFFYSEENYAGYLSGSYQFSEKWSAKAGLRYEYTWLRGYSPNENLTNTNSYGKFFPTLYLAYKPNDKNSLSASYSRRIQRPYFGNLNPFRTYSSAYEYSTGNPYLQPSFADNYELGYVLDNNFSVTAFYNHSDNDWDRIQRMENGVKYSIVLNFYRQDQLGVNLNYNFTEFKWLESNMFASFYYGKSKSFVPEAIASMKGYGANFNMDNSFFLNSAKTVTLVLGIWGEAPNREGNTYFKGNFSAYSGFKLQLMDKNLMLNLFVNDILNTQKSIGTEYYQDFSSRYSDHWNSRNINLSLTYKFGNQNVKGATKQVKFDEQSRVGSSSGN